MAAPTPGPHDDGQAVPPARPPAWLIWARIAMAIVALAVIAIATVLLRGSQRGSSAAGAQQAALNEAASSAPTAPAADAVAQPAAAPDGPLGALGGGPPKEGQPAPDFALRDVRGNRVQLSSLRGQAIVVNFWATWCGPCTQEFPELQKAAQAAGPGVVVLALDQAEPAGAVTAFRNRYGATFDILMDSSNTVAGAYKFSGIPDTVFIDRAGVVRHISLGPLSAGTFSYWIGKTLAAQ